MAAERPGGVEISRTADGPAVGDGEAEDSRMGEVAGSGIRGEVEASEVYCEVGASGIGGEVASSGIGGEVEASEMCGEVGASGIGGELARSGSGGELDMVGRGECA